MSTLCKKLCTIILKLSTSTLRLCKKKLNLSTENRVVSTENCEQLALSKVIACIVLTVMPILLTGCWDSMEINDRSVILEFCLDKNTEYAKDDNIPLDKQERYEMSYSIPDMAKLSGTDSLLEDVKTAIHIKAPTIRSGIDDLETKMKDTLSFSHVKAFLVGHHLLQDSKLFKEAIESISRDMLLKRNVPILAIKDVASKVTEVNNGQHPIVGLYLMDYFNNKERTVGYFKHQLLGNFIREIEDTGVSTMPLFQIGEDSIVSVSGGAVIKDYKLVDYLSKEEVRGQLLIEGKARNLPIVSAYKDEYLTYMLRSQKSHLKFERLNQMPINQMPVSQAPANEAAEAGVKCTIEIETDGILASHAEGIQNEEDVQKVKAILEKEIKRQVQVALDRSKELGVDFFQIGLELYRKHPKWWEKYKDNWQEGGYLSMPIEVTVSTKIKHTGIIE